MQVSFQLISIVLVCLQSEADSHFSATKTTVSIYARVVRMRQSLPDRKKCSKMERKKNERMRVAWKRKLREISTTCRVKREIKQWRE